MCERHLQHRVRFLQFGGVEPLSDTMDYGVMNGRDSPSHKRQRGKAFTLMARAGEAFPPPGQAPTRPTIPLRWR